ncbi:hypothetical protein WJX77_008042 [Trebouxia sp. C0004]
MTSASRATLGVLALLILCVASRPAQAGLWRQPREQPGFSTVPARIAAKGQGSLTELRAQAAGETFVNKLLGTDCFTKSLSIVNKDCSKLDLEKKSRLAMALAICHLDQLGLPAFTCKPSMTLKQCADNIKDDRQYTTYLEFLSNVDTMCLFLQSQDFQRHTEFMINSLYSSSQHATEQLEAVDSHLKQSLLTIEGLDRTLGGVTTAQLQQLQLAEQNLKSVGQLHNDSQALHTQLEHVLQNEELVLTKQNKVLSSLASLDEEEAARARAASSRWQEAQEQASELLVQQQQYQQVQQQLLGDLRQLSDSSAGLRTALDVVVQYEERGAAMLTHMLGSTCSVQDLLGYALAAVGIAAMGLSKATKGARLPLILLFALSVVAERAMMHSMHHLLEIDHTGQVGLSLPVFGIPINLKSTVRSLCLATAVAQVMWASWKHSDLKQETLRACRRMEAQQQQQLQSLAALNQELREAQKQQYIDFMATLRSSGPNVHPRTPTRTPNGQLADDAGHVPQLQWQSDGADGYEQQLPQQLHKQHESNHDAKSTPSRRKHGSHDTDASEKTTTQAEKCNLAKQCLLSAPAALPYLLEFTQASHICKDLKALCRLSISVSLPGLTCKPLNLSGTSSFAVAAKLSQVLTVLIRHCVHRLAIPSNSFAALFISGSPQ